jgi:hypothetical protein
MHNSSIPPDQIGRLLMSQEAVELKPENKLRVPTQPGLYAFFTKGDECLYVGCSDNLRHRIFIQHYTQGSDPKSGSDLIYIVQHQVAGIGDRSSARQWIKNNCLVRWLIMPNLEKELRKQLKPTWGKR